MTIAMKRVAVKFMFIDSFMSNEILGQFVTYSYRDNIIILLNFIFTSLHGYEITSGF